MKCIIIDDEPKARFVLEKLIGANCPSIEILAFCENLDQAKEVMLEKQPDLIFLDMQLPGSLGLSLIQNQSDRSFAVIITTAHEEYAVQGFEYNAQDYLLKPIQSKRLIKAVEKASFFLQSKKEKSNSDNIIQKDSFKISKVPIPVENGLEMIAVNDIIRIQASGSYSEIYLKDEEKKLVSKSMRPIEELLSNFSFYRIHNSHLINLDHLEEVQRLDGGFAIMSDGSEIEISRRKMSDFLKYLNQN